MAEDAAARTEEPTPRRLEEARAEGRLPQSTEVTSAAVLLAGLLVAWHGGGSAVTSMREMMRRSLQVVSANDLTPGQIGEMVGRVASDSFSVVAPLLAATAAAAIAVTTAQVGFRILGKRILPDKQKLSPAKTLQRIFSSRGLVDLVKALAKIMLIGWVGWKVIWAGEERILTLAMSAPREILAAAGGEIRRLVAWAVAVAAVLAVFDYAWQRHTHHQSLRMTRTEVKDERRQSEGDPQVRARVRRAYQQLSKRRMLADVPTADVVITNPVRLAVALRYLAGEMGAPRVVAKGAEHVAERIREIARQHGIPIVERRSLAQALFRTVPVGGEIPAALYRAVAEILAYIYGLRKRAAG